MIKGDVSQANLARTSQLSKTMIGNICNNTNGRKGKYKKTYTPDMNTVQTMARTWGLNKEQTFKLFCIAFPVFEQWIICTEKNLNVADSNDLIYEADHSYPLLGGNLKD